MSLICFTSQKGAPGTTLMALATAASWPASPNRRKLFLEADPDGGVLAMRYGLGVEPGLVTLAAAVRGGIDSSTLFDHAQELPGGLGAVVCPDSANQVHAALSASGHELGLFLAGLDDVDVIADVGRLSPTSPALSFVAAARSVLMVARPSVEELQPAARRLSALASRFKSVGWVLVGDGPHNPGEVEATYGWPVVAAVPSDPKGAAAVAGAASGRRARRTPLVRSAATLADNLVAWLHPDVEKPVAKAEQSRNEEARTPTAEGVSLSDLAGDRVPDFLPDAGSVSDSGASS